MTCACMKRSVENAGLENARLENATLENVGLHGGQYTWLEFG